MKNNNLLLQVLKENVKEKYNIQGKDIVEDVNNCINILFGELNKLYDSSMLIENSSDVIADLIDNNEETLCPICARKENDTYITFQNICDLGITEMERIIQKKQIDMYCILTMLLQSYIPEIAELFDYSIDEIHTLTDEQIMNVIITATEDVLTEATSETYSINYFETVIDNINSELEQLL